LRLSVRREGERLSFQVNQMPPVVFEEVLPAGRADAGVFAIVWPKGGRLESLRAAAATVAGPRAPLEEADRHYADGRYADARAIYREQASKGSDIRLRPEAWCKEALCLLKLGETAGAISLLEQVAAGTAPRWSVVAAGQLWLLRLRQKQLGEADVLLTSIYSRYRPEQ